MTVFLASKFDSKPSSRGLSSDQQGIDPTVFQYNVCGNPDAAKLVQGLLSEPTLRGCTAREPREQSEFWDVKRLARFGCSVSGCVRVAFNSRTGFSEEIRAILAT